MPFPSHSDSAIPCHGVRPTERVVDYPRPPLLMPCELPLRLEALGLVLAEGERSLRVLETFHPPSFYLPPEAMNLAMLQPAAGRSVCEWKGVARYFDVVLPEGEQGDGRQAGIASEVSAMSGSAALRIRIQRAVWQYPDPTPAFAELAGWYSVYPALIDACWLDGERVIPQPGGFYGGWITHEIEGPFKGDPAHPELV